MVFGWGHGFAEFAITEPSKVAKVPSGQQVGEYGIYPCVGTSAYQLLRKHWLDREDMNLRHLLVIGASGGVGSSIIQMVRAIGGPEIKIYAVGSVKNQDYLKSIGANVVFDYMQPGLDIGTVTPLGAMDLIVDLISGTPEGTEYVEQALTLLRPHGRYITLNTLSSLEYIAARFSQLTGFEFYKNYDFFVVNRGNSASDLTEVASLVATGKYKLPVNDEVDLDDSQIRSAFNFIRQRHVRGKIKVIIDPVLCQQVQS